MLLLLLGLSFLFNFTYGVLLPIVPHLNEDVAGWAFTSFLLFKLLWLIPAGHLNDRLGSRASLLLALLIQIAALAAIALLPHQPWLGRALEGVALAQGTLSTFGVLRELSHDPRFFQSAVAKLLSIGGLGMIIGPYAGYALLPLGPLRAIFALVGLTALFTAAQAIVGRRPPGDRIAAPGSLPLTEPTPVFWFIAGLTAAKALAVGWEPNLAWWAQSELHFPATIAGLSFLVLGASFVVGSLRPHPAATLLSLAGFLFLEWSLAGTTWAWWPALAALGFWYGTYVTLAVGKLGWNAPEKIGRHNSVWMLVTDLPMAFVPAVLWEWRADEAASYRWWLAGVLLLVAGISLWRGLAPGSHAPTQNYQA